MTVSRRPAPPRKRTSLPASPLGRAAGTLFAKRAFEAAPPSVQKRATGLSALAVPMRKGRK